MHVNTSRLSAYGTGLADHGLLEIGSKSLNVTLTIHVCNVECGFTGVNKWCIQTSSNSFHLSQLTFKHIKNCLRSVGFHSANLVCSW